MKRANKVPSDLSGSDLRIIAQVKRIALNLDSLYRLLEGLRRVKEQL